MATSTTSGAANYPYSLPWPPEQLESDWTFATAAWDGKSRIDHGNKYTDHVETSDGSVFAFGIPMNGGPEELRQLVAQQAVVWHGCEEEPVEEESLTGGETEGIYGVYTCGSRTILRWFGVHDGFGLFIGLIVDPGAGPDLDLVTTRYKDQIGNLKWTD